MKDVRPTLIMALVTLAALSAADTRIELGKLGQATTKTAVYSAASRHARLYYRVKPYEYLVVKETTNPNWAMVLLRNRTYGYVPASTVVELPYTYYYKPRPRIGAGSRGATLPSRTGNAAADYAMQFQGTPYEWGGNDLQSGIDCSGFVKKIEGSIGVDLPRTAAEQALVGTPIYRLEDLVPGDRLYFWEKARGKIGHTGLYLGNGYFIHASHGRGQVATDYLSAGWRKILVAARRS